MKFFLTLFLSAVLVYSVQIPMGNIVGDSVVSNDKQYYKHMQNNIEIIYTKDNLKFAKHISKIEPSLSEDYENFYDWSLDEKLSIGLISDYKQEANGFSTQYPNNRQINYVGGTQLVDYFTTTSWLDTLFYHETAHNYQLNVKEASSSKFIHSIFGNGSVIFPFFTIPNVTENSFMLEGNAVLNESWHGNGGRLYSGRLYAQAILQAKAGNINAGKVYNKRLEFPYGDSAYIDGGFYNLYMAEKYGLKSINSYFKHHSYDWSWPFFTNESMKDATGIDFEDSLKEYSDSYKKLSESMVVANGEHIAFSQFFYQLNSDEKEIFFLTNESGVRAPELIRVNKKDFNVTKKRDSFYASKLIKDKDSYFTQASANISPTKIIQGLYDSDKFIKTGSESKMVQGYLSDGREVYFDIPKSYSEPQLFIDGKFYAKVNSSVFIDKDDNLYYFVQNNKKRTLYKNKIPLMSLNGYYGFVNDVDSKGGIYFISNSKYGSSLFLYKDFHVSRVSAADNIVEARIIDEKKLLLAAIGEDNYYYVKTDIINIDETPYEVKLFFEDKEYFARSRERDVGKFSNLDNKYHPSSEMRYSGLDLNFISSTDGVTGSLNLKFADPLGQNAINAFASRDNNKITIAGVGYQSTVSVLNYGIYGYSVVDNSLKDSRGDTVYVRGTGVYGYATLPIEKEGYYESNAKVYYYQDYATTSREPFSIELSFSKLEHFGVSMYENYLNFLSLFNTNDREDSMQGVKYRFRHDLANEFYVSLDAKYSATFDKIQAVDASLESRGVKIDASSFTSDFDASLINMSSISQSVYVKNAGYVDVGIAKVLNISSYYFTFPLSLQRESIYAKYKYFNIESFTDEIYNVAEITAGFSASVVLFNNFVLPFGIEYIYNDTFFAKDKNQLFFKIGSSF